MKFYWFTTATETPVPEGGVMARTTVVAIGVSTLIAGVLTWAAPPASAANAVCPVAPAPTAFAQATGTVTSSGSPVAGAAVYAIDTESGMTACVLTNGSGVFSVALPAVSGTSPARKPADSWYLIANPAGDSNLASGWRQVATSGVSLNASVANQNLVMESHNLKVQALQGTSTTPINGPAFVCITPEEVLDPPTNCGVTQSYGGTWRAQLRVPATGKYWASGAYMQPSGWSEGWSETSISAGSPATVAVNLYAQGSQPCETGLVAVTGVVTKASIPMRVTMSAGASSQYGTYGLGWADSSRDGSYQICLDPKELPPGQTMSTATLGLVTRPFAGGVSTFFPLTGCATGCVRNLQVPPVPSVAGSIRFNDDTPGAGVFWSVAQMDGDQSGPDFLFGTADAAGAWGAAGLPNGDYRVSVYPSPTSKGFAPGQATFSIPSASPVNVSIPRGNLTLRVTDPNGDPQAGVWVEARNCVDDNCDFRGGSSNLDGYASFLLTNGTWILNAYPNDQRLVQTSATVVVSGGVVQSWNGASPAPAEPELQLRSPNVTFKVQRAGNLAVPQSNVNLAPWGGGQNDPWDWNSSSNASTDDSGLGRMWLDGDGAVYQLRVSPPASVAVPALVKYIQVEGSGSGVTLRQCEAPADWRVQPCQPGDDSTALTMSDGAWVLEYDQPNIAGVVRDPEGDLQAYAGIEIARLENFFGGGTGYNQLQGPQGWTESSDSGGFAIALSAPGAYRLKVNKPWNSAEDWAAGMYYFQVDGSLNVCLKASASSSCTPTGRLVDDSSVTLSLGQPNVTGTVRQVNGQILKGGYLSVLKSSGRLDCPDCRDWLTGTEVSRQGKFSLNLDSSDDTYYLQVYPWNVDDTSVESTFELTVGPGQTFVGPDALQLTLRGSNVVGTVRAADNSVASNSWIGVEKRLAPRNWQWVQGGAQTNEDGEFRMFLPAGQYRLRVEPGQSVKSKATTTRFPVGDDTYFTVPASGTKTIDITLGSPNVSGEIYLPSGGGAAENSWVYAQKWNADREFYEWSDDVTGTSSASDGAYALDMPNGRWKLVAEPPWNAPNTSRNERKIIVSDSGVCEDNGSGVCGAALGAGGVDITLRSPNVSGTVVDGNGEPVTNTWVDVRRWNTQRSEFEWSPDLNGLGVNWQGKFSANLSDGRYQLAANPPYGDANSSRTTAIIVIAGNLLVNIDDSVCPPSGCASITIKLGQPNISGTVMAGSSPVSSTSVYVEEWDADRNGWQWFDRYSNSNQDGQYALNVTDPGSYRITARPTNQTPGYAAGRRYFVVESSSDLCLVSNESAAKSTTTCPSSNDDSLPNTQISLAPANLVGLVTDGSSPVSDAWLQLFRKSTYGYEWVEGTGSAATGRFGFNVDVTSTTEYRVEAFPPQGSQNGWTRQRTDVIAYLDGGTTKVCPKSSWTGAACPSGMVLGDDTPLAMAFAGGNLQGFVKTPVADGNLPVRDTFVSVEKWEPAPSNPSQYFWQWSDLYANTTLSGGFSLTIDDTGSYRVTAWPAWNDDSGYTKVTSVIKVNNSGAWCPVDDSTAMAADTFDACNGSFSNPGSRLTMNLQAGNISTTVRNPQGSPVRDAWVGVRQLQTTSWGSYWVWLGGSSTKSNGGFTTFIDDSGTYALDVNPPWRGTDDTLPRFTEDFTVSCAGATCTSTLPASISFPAPNMTGQVVSPDSASIGVANSWVSVEREISPGNYRWTDYGTSTNSAGTFVLNLPTDDTYRLTANPSWENPVGARASVTVRVVGGVATCITGCLSGNKVQLLKPNLTGTLVDGATNMAYSWVEVRDRFGNWVTGSPTNVDGEFAINVPADDTYTVWGYPNWGLSQKPPKSVQVVVPAVGVASTTIDLGAVVPNLTLTIQDDSGVTGSHLVAVDQWNGSAWVGAPQYTATSTDTADSQAIFKLPNGTWRLTVLPSIGKTIAPSSTGQNQVSVTITGADPNTPTLFTASVTFAEVTPP